MDINQIIELEQDLNLTNLEIDGLNLWHINRFLLRYKLIGEPTKTVEKKINIASGVYHTFVSFCQLTKLLIKPGQTENVVFPHLRCYIFEGEFLERITDPVINLSSLKDKTVFVEFPQNGVHHKPRYFKNKIIYFDFILLLSFILSPILKMYVKIKHKNKITALHNELERVFGPLDNSYLSLLYSQTAKFFFYIYIYQILLSKLNPKRIFLAPREGYYAPIIPICKKNKIQVIEFQHGITLGNTALYGGEYNELFDPDYFLAFGSGNISPFFRIPVNQIINIGFAFKNLVKSINKGKPIDERYILVASEPHITTKIIDTLLLLSSKCPELIFHLRLHPQESISTNDLCKLSAKIVLVDNKVDSFIVINNYQTVLGDNSSVLFEAMSLQKKVGRLSFNGLTAIENNFDSGVVIKSIDEFKKFVYNYKLGDNHIPEYHSDFSPDNFDSVLNELL